MKNLFKPLLPLLAIITLAASVNAQAPVIAWDDYYPEYIANVNFQAKDILETPTGGIVILGEKRYASQTNTYTNVLVIRLNKDGYMIWAKEYGGINMDFIRDTNKVIIDTLISPWTHEVNSMILTPRGNYLITGFRDTTSLNTREFSPPGLLLMEIAPTGEIVFDSLYYNSGLTKRMGYNIQPANFYGSDEGYIVTGMGQNDGTGPDLIMLASFIRDPDEGYKMAEIPYNKPVDAGASGYATWVRSLPDGYLLAGTCRADLDNHIFLMEINKSNTTRWLKKYGGPADDAFSDAVIAGDNIYITGSSKVPVGPMSDLLYQIYVVKTDMAGDTIWTRTYGGNSKYYGRTITIAEDGNLMVVATETSTDFLHTYISLLKIDAVTGDLLWMQSYGTGHFYSCSAGAVAKTSDFGYLIAGRASYITLQDPRIYVMRLNNSAETMTWAVNREDINLDIVPGTSAKDVISVSAEVLGFYGVFVKIDTLLHPSVGELTITLEHSGTTVTLVDQPFHSGENFINTGFIDAAEYPIESGFAPYSGLFQPEEPLFGFMGHQPSGDWTLTITDHGTGGLKSTTRILEDWNLNLLVESGVGISKPTQEPFINFGLDPVHPNPFSHETEITFRIPQPGHVSLTVYNQLGQVVGHLADEDLPEGSNRISWSPDHLAPGTYFIHLESGGMISIRKAVLTR